MRDFVIDANILMSVLISGKASYRPLFTHFNFMLPEFVLVEVAMRDEDFLQWTYFVFSQITILPQYAIAAETLKKSKHLLDNIDLKDVAYVALAMQLDLPLLTRDNRLYEGLRKKGFRKVILFEDFLKSLQF